MKTYRREIVICMLTALATLTAVWFFFGYMKKGKMVVQTDLYSLTAPSPDALLMINRPGIFSRVMLSNESVYQAFSTKLPDVFTALIQEGNDLPALLFSFHPEGVVLYAKVNENQLQTINQTVLRPRFNSFAPRQQQTGDITFTFYPDVNNRFFGYYHFNGIWVASYSKKLLEEVARQQTTGQISLSPELRKTGRKSDPNAPLNIQIESNRLNLYVTKSDSTEWRIRDKWLSADLFSSEGNICYFGSLPYFEYADTLYTPIADTLSIRLNHLFPQLQFTTQANRDSLQVLYTGCSPM